MTRLELSATLFALVLAAAACVEDSRPTDTGAPADSGTADGAADGATADATADASGDATVDAAPDAAAADTWASFAMDFFATYCVECHSGGTSPRDYRTITDVQRDAEIIRCGVSDVPATGCGASPAPMQFPIGTGPHPTDTERQRLVAWIDAGLPE